MEHHPDARFQTPDALRAHYTRVYNRLYSAGARYQARVQAERLERLRLANEARDALHRERHAQLEALSLAADRASLRATPSAIIRSVARSHGVDAADITGAVRTSKVIQARWEAMARVKAAYPSFSLPKIGALFNKDHTTVLHALRRVGIKSDQQAVSP